MTSFYGYKRLKRVDDWRGLAGDDKWVPTRSAYELAYSWQQNGGPPEGIVRALNESGQEVLAGIEIDLCLVEKPVFLDTMIGPSMTDLMAYGRNRVGNVIVMAVEGKADESFGPRVSDWVRGETRPVGDPRPTRLRRLEFLGKNLPAQISPDSRVRYQLLHRTVSAVLEAQIHGASAAIVVVHAFGELSQESFADYADFLGVLGARDVKMGFVIGPVRSGEKREMPMYFLWWQQLAFGVSN